MAILRIDFRDGALSADPDALAREARARAGDSPAGRPTVVLVHGYKYDPSQPQRNPHALLYSADAPAARVARRGRVLSWPQGLGIGAEGADGLCLGYGWSAWASWTGRLLAEGRNGFAAVYDEAGRAGASLVPALAALAEARPAPVDLLAHSLGARVALSALRAAAKAGRGDLIARLGRWILLGPAEFSGAADAALAACARIGARPPEIYCLTARHNARYDRLFAAFAPRAARSGAPLGAAAPAGADPARWAHVRFDHPGLPDWLAARGVTLGPAPERGACHWSFYRREGAMDLHRAIIARAPGFTPADFAPFAPAPARPRPCGWIRALRPAAAVDLPAEAAQPA